MKETVRKMRQTFFSVQKMWGLLWNDDYVCVTQWRNSDHPWMEKYEGPHNLFLSRSPACGMEWKFVPDRIAQVNLIGTQGTSCMARDSVVVGLFAVGPRFVRCLLMCLVV